jgi:serine/threonine-protein kinase
LLNLLDGLKEALAGRYDVEREVGRGGMGTVYLAQDLKHRRRVAVKTLRPELAATIIQARFLREIEIAAGLTHSHILPVHDSGEANGFLYFVMPYIEGETLRQRMARERQLAMGFALRIAREVAEALDYAHRRHLVHRDIKPENILLSDGHALVADFGIALAVSAAQGETLTRAGLAMGTPRYMSPEQARGKRDLDGRSDIFSLGCVLYEMLVGHTPEMWFDQQGVAEGRFRDTLPEHRAQLEALPVAVQRALVRALAKLPDDRFATAEQFAKALTPPPRYSVTQWSFMPEADEGTKPVTIATERPAAGRRSRLVRVGAAYAAVALPMLLVVQLVMPSMLPWAVVVIAAVALLGFAAATLRVWRLGALRAAVSRTLRLDTDRTGTAMPVSTDGSIRSIAVLPFADMSSARDQEYFSDGIAEELLNTLAKVDGLRVAARTSSFHFKGKNQDVRRIGKQLGVASILEGSVRKSDDRLRITAQLVNTADGFHLWSEAYDRQLADIFTVQEEIAGAIVDALRIRLPGGRKIALGKERAPDFEAHNLYLQGRYLWNKRTKVGLEEAVDRFQQAIERDLNYAPAYAGLADAYLLLGSYRHMPRTEALQDAKQAAERAIALDETLAEAHTSRGQVLRSMRNWDAEEQAYRRAIALNPSYATAHHWYATLLSSQGHSDEALREIRRAEELDPLSHAISVTVAVVLFLAGDYDAAMEQLQKALKLEPNFFSAYRVLAATYTQKGQYQEAIQATQRAMELSPENPDIQVELAYIYAVTGRSDDARQIIERARAQEADPGFVGLVYAALGERDRAFDCLWEAFEKESWMFLFMIKVGPWFDPVRSDLRFNDLLRRMNFSQ